MKAHTPKTQASGIDSTMSIGRNGPDQSVRNSTRRFRVDDIGAIVIRNSPGPSAMRRFRLVASRAFRPAVRDRGGIRAARDLGDALSGFSGMAGRYRERALYGATQVLPAIDKLRAITPTNVDPVQWRKAVDQTGSMLITVTGSNLLDVKDMDRLRDELDQHASRATDHPETAIRELGDIWDEIADRAHSYSPIADLSPVFDTLGQRCCHPSPRNLRLPRRLPAGDLPVLLVVA